MLERFRASQAGERYCLIMGHEEDEPIWYQINPNAIDKRKIYQESTEIKNLPNHIVSTESTWFDLSPEKVMCELNDKLKDDNLTYEKMTKRYGEITLINYSKSESPEWSYHPQLGIFTEI